MGKGKEVKEEKEQERVGQSSKAGICRKTADDVRVLTYGVSHGKHKGNRVGHINYFRKS